MKLHFIKPGNPMQNGFDEGFNSRFRNQCLNEHWRQICNAIKPHSSLGRKTPAEFAALCSGIGQNTEHNLGLTRHNQPGKLST